MKKTLFLSAILGAALCSSAFAGQKTTVTSVVDGVTYNGGVYTFGGTGAISGSTHTAYVNSADGSIHAGDTTPWGSFASNQSQTYGHTIRLTASGTYESNFSPFSLGGLITEGYDGTATIGRAGTKVEITGSNSVNMTIKSNATILGNNGIEVFDSGAWTVASGKTLTLSSTSNIKIDANKTVSLSGDGTTVFNGKLVLAGNLTNGGTATISSLSLEGGSLANNGTLNLNNAAITATDAALSDKHLVDYTGATSTTGGFAAGTITVLTNGQGATVTGSGTLSYGGATYSVDNDHTTHAVTNYTSYTLNSGSVAMSAVAQAATDAGAAAPTSLILDTTGAKAVDMSDFTTALTAQAKNGTTTITNANDSSANFELRGGNAKLVFSGDTAQTIGKIQGNAVSEGFEVAAGSSLTASEISGGWCMRNQVVNGELHVTGNYSQKVANTPLLQGTGSMVVDGTYTIGNNTNATITLAEFSASATTIELGNNNLACSLTIKEGATADLGNVTGVVNDGVTGTMTLNVTGATLTHAGESAATVADNITVNIGNTTITGAGYDFAGNVKLTGTITNTATTLGLQGTLSADALDVFTVGEDVQYSNAETGNGYMTGSYVVVKGVNAGTTVLADTLTIGETSYDLQKGDDITIAMEGIGDGTYFINNDAVYGSDAAMTASDTTAISLNGGKLTINEGTTVSKTISAAQTGTVVLNSGAELNKSQVSATADANVMLAGEGTYVLNNDGLGTGVGLSEDWTGAVRLSGVSLNNINLAPLANEDSVIEMNGFTGWTGNNLWRGDNTQNIKLTDTGTGGAAWSNGAFSQSNDTCTFSGDWSGTGTFKTTGTPGDTRYINYTFSGDVSEWTGAFVKASDKFTSTTLTFTGNATEMGASISHENGNLHLVADADTTFKNTISATDATINAGKTVTMEKQVTLTNGMTVNEGASVSMNDAASMAALTLATNATAEFAQDASIESITLNAGSAITITDQGSLTSSALTVNADSTINGNLVIAPQGTITFDDGAVTLNGTLTLGTGTIVSLGTAYLDELAASGQVLVFKGVTNQIDTSILESIVVTGDFVPGHLLSVAAGDGTYNIYATPEPATATLSLLALAGLMARRKRH